MLTIPQLESTMQQLGDMQLQQYAQANKNDAIKLSAALAEIQRRKAMRGAAQGPAAQTQPVVDKALASAGVLPEESGIASIPLPHMPAEYADGGIVAFGGGGVPKGDRQPSFDEALDIEGVTDNQERAFLRALYAQESGSGADTRTSNRDAVGAMQVRPGTFTEVADTGMDIHNMLDNMRAGIRYGRKGYAAAGGDPVLAGSYYYGGPGGMRALAEGKARSDPKNPKHPDTRTYGQQVAKRMFDLLPMGSAQAAQAAAPAPTEQTAADDGTVYDPVTGVPLYQGLPREPERSAREVVKQALRPIGSGLAELAKTVTGYNTVVPQATEREPFSTGEYKGKSGDPNEDIGPAQLPPVPQMTPKEEKQVVAAAKEARPDLKDEGLSRDDWLTLGFALLSGKSQYALENLGAAGLGMLKARQDRAKTAQDREKMVLDRAKTEQDIALSKSQEAYNKANAARVAAEDKPLAQYTRAVDAALTQLAKDPMYLVATPEVQAQQEAAVRRRVAQTYMSAYPEIANTMYTPAETAAMRRYAPP